MSVEPVHNDGIVIRFILTDFKAFCKAAGREASPVEALKMQKDCGPGSLINVNLYITGNL